MKTIKRYQRNSFIKFNEKLKHLHNVTLQVKSYIKFTNKLNEKKKQKEERKEKIAY